MAKSCLPALQPRPLECGAVLSGQDSRHVWLRSNTTEDADRPIVIKITRDGVSTDENGSGVDTSVYTHFDSEGLRRFSKNAGGRVHYRSYHDKTERLAYSVRDIFTDSASISRASQPRMPWCALQAAVYSGFS